MRHFYFTYLFCTKAWRGTLYHSFIPNQAHGGLSHKTLQRIQILYPVPLSFGVGSCIKITNLSPASSSGTKETH